MRLSLHRMRLNAPLWQLAYQSDPLFAYLWADLRWWRICAIWRKRTTEERR